MECMIGIRDENFRPYKHIFPNPNAVRASYDAEITNPRVITEEQLSFPLNITVVSYVRVVIDVFIGFKLNNNSLSLHEQHRQRIPSYIHALQMMPSGSHAVLQEPFHRLG